jgi:two-component system, glycerol uptake and utilization response regulator
MSYKYKILVVDDKPTNIEILLYILSPYYDIIALTKGKKALALAKKELPDLILLDIVMPELDGYEVCKKLKKNPDTKDIPIIFITANSNEDSIEKAYDIGGIDYITKPFKSKELLARIKTQMTMKEYIKELKYLSEYDTMTDVLNRRKFFELALKKFDKATVNLYAIMIDIDEFKSINDSYGHDIGDEVIKFIAKKIKNSITQNAILGRLGGEEFAIINTYKDKNCAKKNIEKIRKKIEQNPIIIKDINISVTISCGISQYHTKLSSIDQLLKEADSAMYEAKHKGRNTTVVRQ